MDHMQRLGLPGLASDFKDLSVKVMEHELSRYVRSAKAFQAQGCASSIPTPMPMPTPVPAPSSTAVSDTYSMLDIDSQEEGEFLASDTGEPADSTWELSEDGYILP
jgi:hypothetical protein